MGARAWAIDASLSMMAPDERPSRLERVKQEVRRLRAMSQADRVALIAFAGRSYILTPLTGDDGAIELFLDNLDPSVVGQAGSSLARALRQGTELLLASDGSAAALEELDPRSRRIVQERWLKVNDDGSGGMTLHELAAEYQVSAERIRQIEVAAMKKMRKALAAYA